MDFGNLALAFIEGLALIVSPCILPILPIVLSAGLEGGKTRPYGIIVGFIGAFCTFTLLSRTLVNALGVDTLLVRQVSFILLLLFGIVMVSTFLSERFGMLTQTLSRFGNRLSYQANPSQGFWSGLLVGIFIGLIWSPCVGPIIAIILVQAIRQTSNVNSVLTLCAFSLGVGLPMLLITLGGKQVMSKLDFFKLHSVLIRKALGIVIIATVLLTAGGDLFHFPASASQAKAATPQFIKIRKGLANPYPAPDFTGINAWINTKPLTMSELKNKVVLVDFWTYSCINCVRTLPYITAWDQKYRNQGLVIVGVHSPEFDFEKNVGNVQAAVQKQNIHYPVALDNRLDTFTAFNNQYWPAHYLIDRSGRVVYTHFGEGEYDVTESNIRTLLGVQGKTTARHSESGLSSVNQTPETYLGFERATAFQSLQPAQHNKPVAYTIPNSLPMDSWALGDWWTVGRQQVTAQKAGASLKLRFTAKKVFLVLGSETGKAIPIQLTLNGKPLTGNAGKDVKNSQLTVQQHTLYELVNQGNAKSGVLEIKTTKPGLEAYAFTFG